MLSGVDMTNQPLINVADPVHDQDGDNKRSRDAAIATATVACAHKVSFITGDSTTTAIHITHNLNTSGVVVDVVETSTLTSVNVTHTIVSANELIVNFDVAPATNGVQVTVVG